MIFRLASLALSLALLAGCAGAPPSGPIHVRSTDSTGSADPNVHRAAAGRAPLTRSARLDAAARAHAQDMERNGFFGHRGSSGSSPAARIRAAGFTPCGAAENIADGPFTEAGVLAAWMGSPGHRRNMLGAGYTDYGLANFGSKWVMTFAGRC